MTGIEDLYSLVIGNPRNGFAGIDLSIIDEEYTKLTDQFEKKLNGKLSKEDECEISNLNTDIAAYSERCGFKAGFKVGVILMTEVFAHE